MLDSSRNQRTLGRPVTITGRGYWSGQSVRVKLMPAAEDTGLVFVRNDVQKPQRIRASTTSRVVTPRRTTLTENGCSVEMVEHVLSALAGMWVDNCEIHVDAQEMPALDGSSLAFVEAIESAGVCDQQARRRTLRLTHEIHAGDEQAWISARPSPHDQLTIAYELDYGPGPIGRQHLALPLNPDHFARELAAARTFLLEHEAAALLAEGKGLQATHQDLLVFGPDGPIDNPLRFADECVRHKMLDIVGDLALVGYDLRCEIIAYRSGHRHNTDLAAQIAELAAEPMRISA